MKNFLPSIFGRFYYKNATQCGKIAIFLRLKFGGIRIFITFCPENYAGPSKPCPVYHRNFTNLNLIMNLIFKRILLATVFAVCCLPVVRAQWDLENVQVDRTKWVDYTPVWNPDYQLMVPGGGSTGYLEQAAAAERAGKPAVARQRRLAASGNTLPSHWNNAETSYFPPVFGQAGGSCGVASRVGYMLNEELNAYRGTNAKLDENHLAPNFQYPFSYNGTSKETMAYYVGYPDAKTYGGYPYSKITGYHETTANNAGWMQGYDKWFVAMHNRIWSSGNFPVGIIGKPANNSGNWGYGGHGEGALAVKRWLYNHNGDESFHTGGILGLGCAAATARNMRVPASNANNQNGFTNKYYTAWGTGVDHAITLVGYDDRIEFDLDGNGIVGERNNSLGLDEVGAWIIVNSWGNWNNGGFTYTPYALGCPTTTEAVNASTGTKYYKPDSNTGWTPEFYNIRKDYSPERTIKLKISFTQRSAIQLQVGVSTNLNATTPDKVLTFHHFNYQGDGDGDGVDAMTPMLGRWANGMHYEPMEFGYDLTDLSSGYDRSQPLKYFFIINSKNTATGVGGIHAAGIIDYATDAEGVETPFEIRGDSVNIGNRGATTVISTVVYGDPMTPPANLTLNASALAWDLPKGTAYKPASYIVYKDGKQVGTTTNRSYNIGSNIGSYTVTARYAKGSGYYESAPSCAVRAGGLKEIANAKYITVVGRPLSNVNELQAGMTVVLYNNGRDRYIYDNGRNTNYLFTSAAPVTLNPDCFKYVFKVGKSGSRYTFTSMNGGLPAISYNNQVLTPGTAGAYTVTAQGNNLFTLYSSIYLNGTGDKPLGWSSSTDATSMYKIIPVDVATSGVSGLGNYTSMTAANLVDGQAVVLYNNGRNYYMVDQGKGSNYTKSITSPASSSTPENYIFRIGKNANGTVTLTSKSGSIGVLPYNTGFQPSDKPDNLTLTDLGNGLFRLQSSTATNGNRQYLDGNGSYPVGWNAAENNGKWRFYPVNFDREIHAAVADPGNVSVSNPVTLRIEGDEDFVAFTWQVDGVTYTSPTPTVTFNSAGNKNVTCTVCTPTGATKSCSRTINVQAAPQLTAEFNLSAPHTTGSDRISFLPVNKLAGCSYVWSMPGADVDTATTRNTSASYSTVGTKTVTLVVIAPNGVRATYSRDFEVRATAPKADYQLDKSVVLRGEPLSITDKSKYAPTTWAWHLVGKNNVVSSSEQHPTFSVSQPGVYDLKFTAANAAGSNTVSFERAVTVCSENSYNGLNFTGGNMKLNVPLSNNISTAWTIDFWLNPTSLSTECFGITSAGGVAITSDGAGKVTVKKNGTVLAASSIAYYVEKQWHHYAITFDGSKIYFYRDGSQVSSANCSVNNFNVSFASLTIGGSSAPATGIFDEFRVWNTCLSQEKIRSYAVAPIANVAAAMSGDGLDVYYQFNQTGGNATDATTHNYTGVRSNFGPDGDAWILSEGVFALGFEAGMFMPVGGLLDQSLYTVIDASDQETCSESAPATNALDNNTNTIWHSAYSKDCGGNRGYPHSLTIDRMALDTIQSIMFYIQRASNYHPTSVTVEESDFGKSWTPVAVEIPLISDISSPGVVLTTPATKRYVKISFPTGNDHLALNEIYFYGKSGPMRAIDTNQETMVSMANGAYTSTNGDSRGQGGYAYKWTSSKNQKITMTVGVQANNMVVRSDATDLYESSVRADAYTYQVNAASGWVITGYEFDFTNSDASKNMTVTSENGTSVTCLGNSKAHFAVSNLSAQSTKFYVTSTGTTTSGRSGKFVNATKFYIYYKSTTANSGPYTVTYRVLSNDGKQLYKAYVENNVTAGTVKNALPATLSRPYCSYSSFNKTINSNTIIDVRCTWNGPFTISQANDTTFYYLKFLGRNKYVKFRTSDNRIPLETAKAESPISPIDKWAFFGNPYAGFYLSNAAVGSEGMCLNLPASNDATAMMTTAATRFFVAPSTNSAGGFVMKIGDATSYVNDYAGKGYLSAWNSANAVGDNGSRMAVEVPNNCASYVQSEIAPYMTTNVGSGYVGTLSTESRAAFNAEYTARCSAATFSQYRSLLSRVKAATVPFESRKFYRLRNNHTGKYAYMDNADRKLHTCANKQEARALIGSVFQFVKGAEGVYTINVQGVPVHGVSANSKVFSTLPTADGALASTIFTVSQTVPGQFVLTNGVSMHNYQGNTVIGWGSAAGASQWNLEPADYIVVTPSVQNGVGYTTLYLPFNVTINAAQAAANQVNFYIMERTAGNILSSTLVSDNVIPAGTGVILRNAAGNTQPNVQLAIGGVPTADLSANVFKGTNLRISRDTGVKTYVFALSNGQPTVNLYTAANLAANTAFVIEGQQAVRGFQMTFDEDSEGAVTAIDDVLELMNENSTPAMQETYDLQGRRVGQPQKGGVYITGGKKVYVK